MAATITKINTRVCNAFKNKLEHDKRTCLVNLKSEYIVAGERLLVLKLKDFSSLTMIMIISRYDHYQFMSLRIGQNYWPQYSPALIFAAKPAKSPTMASRTAITFKANIFVLTSFSSANDGHRKHSPRAAVPQTLNQIVSKLQPLKNVRT